MISCLPFLVEYTAGFEQCGSPAPRPGETKFDCWKEARFGKSKVCVSSSFMTKSTLEKYTGGLKLVGLARDLHLLYPNSA